MDGKSVAAVPVSVLPGGVRHSSLPPEGGKPGVGGPGMMPMVPFRACYTAALEVLP